MKVISDGDGQVKIPPTRLVKPTAFKVASSLKAYLLPLEVFAKLPPTKGKQLAAGSAILHPKRVSLWRGSLKEAGRPDRG